MALDKLPQATDQDSFTTWNWLKKLQTWLTGMFNPNVSSTGSFTLGANFFYPVDTSAGDVTVTLPLAKNSLGKMYYIKKIDFQPNKVIITPNVADTIDAGIATTTILNYWGSCVGLISDGISTWWSLKETALRGDYSDAGSFANFMQTNITDNSTVLGLYPNGVGVTSLARLVGSSDVSLTNSQFVDMRIDGLSQITFHSRKTGSAVALPIVFAINGINAIKFDNNAGAAAAPNIVPGGGVLATTATDGFMYQQACAGTPTGVPTAYASKVPIIYDSTDDKWYYYNSSWKVLGGGGGTGTVTSITATAPIIVTPSPLTTTGVISHATSGVSASTYGDATHVAQVTVDVNGHVTAASSVAITGLGLGVLTRIAQVVTSGSQATVSFSSIPSGYTNLQVVITARDTSNAVNDVEIRLQINGDNTAANYTDTQYLSSAAGSSSSAVNTPTVNGCWIGAIPGTSLIANSLGIVNILIPSYSGTTFQKLVQSYASENYTTAANLANYLMSFQWKNTAAISSLLFTSGGTAFLNGSVFTLYGMP